MNTLVEMVTVKKKIKMTINAINTFRGIIYAK